MGLGKILKKVASVALPIVGSVVGGPVGGALGGALGGAVSGGGIQGALTGGALGALGSGLAGSTGSLANAFGSNALTSALDSGVGSLISPLVGLGSSLGGGLNSLLGSTSLSGIMGGNQNAGYSPGSISSSNLAPMSNFTSQLPQGTQTISGLPWLNQGNSVSNLAGGTGSNLIGKIGNSIASNPASALASILAIKQAINPTVPAGALSAQQVQDQIAAQKARDEQMNQNVIAGLSSPGLARQQTNPQIDYYHYGQRPEQLFYDNVKPQPAVVGYKKGGPVKPALQALSGQSDKVSAKLSPGEYVIPADVVSHLGDGNTNGGASALGALVKNVRQHKQGGNGLPPKAKSPLAYMGATA